MTTKLETAAPRGRLTASRLVAARRRGDVAGERPLRYGGSRRWRSRGRGPRTSWHGGTVPATRRRRGSARLGAGGPVAIASTRRRVPSGRSHAGGAGSRTRRSTTRGRMCVVRILLWHGYLLGGTGSNVYTRQLAREWSRAGHEVIGPQPGGPARATTTSVARRPCGRTSAAFLPVFVLDRYEGFDDVRRVPDCTREELERWVDANAAAVRALLPADLVYVNHVLLGGPVGAATGAAFAVKAHGSELEYAMRGRRDLGAWGAESLDRRARDVRGLGPHPRGGQRGLRAGPARARGAARGRHRALAARGARGRARGVARRGAQATRRTSGTPRSGFPTTGTRRGSQPFLARRASHRRLLRQADRAEGRARPARRAAAASTPASSSSGSGRSAHRSRRTPLPKACARSSPVRSSTGTCGTCSRFADACVVPSVFPEAFGMVAAEAAAAGCPPVVSRHSGLAEVAAELEAALPPALGPLVSFPTGDAARAARAARRAARPARGGPCRAAVDGAAGGRGALELGRNRAEVARAGHVGSGSLSEGKRRLAFPLHG